MSADRQKITAYVMSFNEARQIRAVLESLKWADEIILVDSFSTDGTVEIAREFGAKIISEKFCGFGKLRNFALDAATHDWMFSLDSDERCTPELAEEMRRTLAAGATADAYHVPRKSHFLGRWMRYCGWYPDYRQPQFFNRKKMRYAEELVHQTYKLDETSPSFHENFARVVDDIFERFSGHFSSFVGYRSQIRAEPLMFRQQIGEYFQDAKIVRQ